MARCLDDHPSAICLCESEINRALFRDYMVDLHCKRMNAHGMSTEEAIALLDRRKQDDVESLELWYESARPGLARLYAKPGTILLGDKSPDFYRSEALVRHLAENYPLIYTVRDPRAIYASILVQDDATPEEKAERWSTLIENFRAWEPYLDAPNVLVVRYEDLVTTPGMTMLSVYFHLGLPDSSRFQSSFPRSFAGRFLWSTAIDWGTGVAKEFNPKRINSWASRLSESQIRLVESDRDIADFMSRFGYARMASGLQMPHPQIAP